MAFQQPAPHGFEPPRKLDVYLEAVAAFQAGAATLQAGTALAVHEDGGRLAAVTQDGTAVGLIPADKRAVLSRGPWSGTVRSVKRQAAPAAVHAAASAGQQPSDEAHACQPQVEQQDQQPEQQQEQQQQPGNAATGEQQPVAAAQEAAQQPPEQPQGPLQPAAVVVVQVLVRFTPEEQRWAQRQDANQLPQQMGEEDTARLSTEQFETLGELV